MLTKAEEARIANDKARINDLVSTAVLASYDTTGQLDKAQLLANLNKIPGVDGLPKLVEEMEFDKDHPLKFTVDGYDVTVEWTGKVTVGDLGEGGSTPTPSDKTLTEITLSQDKMEVNEGETVTLTATMTPTDADDTLKFTAEPADNVKITTEGTTATIEGVKAGKVTITVSGTKSSVTAQCTVTVKAVEVAEFNPKELTFDPNGEALHAEYYGTEVKLKNSEETSLANGPWKLFYQDESYTYIIHDELVLLGDSLPSLYESNYNTGEVGAIGKTLNPKIGAEKPTLFTLSSNGNMKGVAYLTDPENWKGYSNGIEGALFAIGGPTMELFRASFNGAKDANADGMTSAAKISEFSIGTYGYKQGTPATSTDSFQTGYCKGIYRKGTSGYWWLASPYYNGSFPLWYVDECDRPFQWEPLSQHYFGSPFDLFPNVCIQ